MKRSAKQIWVMVILGCVIALGFTSCTKDNLLGYDEDEWLTPTDTTTNKPTPESEIPVDSIDWSREMQRTFGYNRTTGEWPSTILIHYTNGRDSVFVHDCPMTSTISGPRQVIVDSLAPASRFVSAIVLSKDSTMWIPENAPIQERIITTKWEINMTNFKDTVTSTHIEARINIGGHIEPFLHGSEPAPTKKDDSPTAGAEVELNGKLYTVEVAHIEMNHKLHASFQTNVQWSTRVLREKTVVPAEEVTPTPTPSMPSPALKVRKIKNIPDYTFSPEFSGNQLIGWHKVLPVLATAEDGKDYYYIWVDGSYVAKVAVGKENRVFNSAYFAEGSWRPATLEKDTDGGWKYVFVVNNEGKLKTVAENLALTSGLQNFRKSDNASQTPSVYTEKNYTEYSGRKYVEVIGFDIDMKPLIKTTIGECL